MLLRPVLAREVSRPAHGVAAALLLCGAVGFGHAALACAAVMAALYAAQERRHAAMLGCYGLALGLSAQALLLAPLIVALAINRAVPWRLWGIAPAVALAAMLAGGATATLPGGRIDAGAPTLWAIAHALPWIGDFPLAGLALAATVGVCAAFIAWFSVRRLHWEAVHEAGLLCVLASGALAPWLQPSGVLLPTVLALAIALGNRRRRAWRIASLVLTGSMLTALADHKGDGLLCAIAALPMLTALVLLGRSVLCRAANDNPFMIRTNRSTSARFVGQSMIKHHSIRGSVGEIGNV